MEVGHYDNSLGEDSDTSSLRNIKRYQSRSRRTSAARKASTSLGVHLVIDVRLYNGQFGIII